MIYVHVPFCRSFCTYCDFYSEVCPDSARGREAERDYVDKVCEEISRRREEIASTLGVNTLYFGGGTPSVLSPSSLRRIVDCLALPSIREFTVEVNPDDILKGGTDYVRALRELGADRVSMGVQSLSDSILRWMNRRHDAASALEAFRILREGGIANISLDIIFGIRGLSDDTLDQTLRGLLALGPEHISAYQLSIEPGSALGRLVESGRYKEAEEEQCSRQYGLICTRLREAGYEHYEISNWALPGRRAIHNSAYWKRLPYVGLGPGAHSFDGTRRFWNSDSLPVWSAGSETLSAEQALDETVMLGLRTSEGVDASLLDARRVASLMKQGALELLDDKVRIPEDRFFVSDDIISELLV